MSAFIPIELPSKCLPYAEKDITIRPYLAKDEIYLSQINPVNLEPKFLQVLKEVVRGIDPKLLTLGDRLYIMIWEYINSYSHTFPVDITCTHCLNDITTPIDLTKLQKIELPDDFKQPYMVKLPDKGREIPLRLLTIQDEIDIENYERKNPDGHLYRYAKSIVSEVDILDKINDLEKLTSKDLAKIRWFHEKFYHGPDMDTTFKCPKCGEEDELTVPFRFEFLYPHGKALADTFGEGI